MKNLLVIFSILFFGFAWSQEDIHKHNPFHSMLENKGQWDEDVLFQSKLNGQNLWIQQHGFIYDLRDYSALQKAHLYQETDSAQFYKQAIVGIEFENSNEIKSIKKELPTKNYYNFFKGKDKSKWVSEVHGYAEVTLENIYNKIDLKLFDDDDQFKYEFWCYEGSNPNGISLKVKNAQSISINSKGDLDITTSLGLVKEYKPIAYELLNGKKSEVPCEFELVGSTVRFKLGKFNPHAILIIDPELIFATYCGSITDNFGMTATYGYDGTAYSAGTIYGNAYPTPDNLAYDVASNFTVPNVAGSVTTDAFISKYTPDGTTMIWTTFIGGGDNTQGTETAHSLICDANNNVYLFGATSSTDFPIQNGFQTTHAGGTTLSIQFNGSNFGTQGTDIFVAKISANGHNLLGSTYVGGSSNDGVNYKISSGTYSSVAAYDSLTTNYGDQFRGEIMLDSLGNCIVTSCSRSTNFPVLNAFQASNAGQQDGVIFKISSDLSTLLWSSYYGGSSNDASYSVKIDSSYNIVFGGGTTSTNLPGTSTGLNPNYMGGKADGFIAKLTPNGQTLTRATYIGTSNYDQVHFVEINRIDEIYALGQSVGGLFPIFNATGNANSGQFIVRLNPNLNVVQNSTTFGNGNGQINISPAAFLVDICGNMYVSGWGANLLLSTPLSGMPVTTDAFQQTPANGFDFYLLVLERDFDGMLYGSYLGGNQAQEHVDGGTSRFDKNGVVYQSVCGGCGAHSDFPTTAGAWSNNNLSPNCNNLVFKFDFELLPDAEFTTLNTLGCEDFTVTLDNFSSQGDTYIWNFGNGDTSTVIFNPTITYTEPGQYIVTLIVTDSICLLRDTAEITINVLPELQLNATSDEVICTPVPLTFTANSLGTATSFVWSSTNPVTDTLNSQVSDSTLTITPTESGFYYVQISNGACTEIDSVEVTIIGSSLEVFGDDSLCIGETTNLTAQISLPSITFTYDWSPDSILTPVSANEVIANPTVSQWVYCTASASNGCVSVDSIFIYRSTFSDVVIATASPSPVVTQSTVNLSVSPSIYSISWSPTSGVENSNAAQTTAVVNQTTIFTATVSDGDCIKSDTALVVVLETLCDKRFVYVPNAFSPNGDGENDVLYVRSAIAEKIVFRIFDRWGELIFESTDMSKGWDGSFRGKMVDPDVYDYYLEATCLGGEQKIIKGNITLMK